MLMDEPFAALDALTRSKMQEELLKLWGEVCFTLLFVTHSIEEALIVEDRIAGAVTASLILIGLMVENFVFSTLERITVRRWGMQR
jgi:ABC-type taurine transport system ATPase subunit